MLPRRIVTLLDVMVGILVTMHVLSSLLGMKELGAATVTWTAVSSLITVGLWVWWRRTGDSRLLIALAAAAFASSIGGGNATGLLMIFIGLALVVLGYGIGAGCLMLLAEVVAMVIVMQAMYHRPLAETLIEGIGTTLILSLALLVGQVLLELKQEREVNRALAAEVRRAAETEKELMLADERSRSARELHDGLGHQLTLIQLSLEYAERMKDKSPERAFEEVHQARSTARDALTYLRRWVRALNPPREENLSGKASFEAIANTFRGTGLDVTVEQTGTERTLDRDSSLFAYRLVQEGLTNVLKHSAADHVRLLVGWLPDRLELQMSDNGGMATGELTAGFGLRSLAERASELGGEFAARTTEQGMVLTGWVPTKEEV